MSSSYHLIFKTNHSRSLVEQFEVRTCFFGEECPADKHFKNAKSANKKLAELSRWKELGDSPLDPGVLPQDILAILDYLLATGKQDRRWVSELLRSFDFRAEQAEPALLAMTHAGYVSCEIVQGRNLFGNPVEKPIWRNEGDRDLLADSFNITDEGRAMASKLTADLRLEKKYLAKLEKLAEDGEKVVALERSRAR